MPSDTFYNEHNQALKPVNIVTRDSLGFLAVEILSSKVDLSTIDDYDELLKQLNNIVSELHASYQRINL